MGCRGPDIPEPGTEAYLEASGAFYSGVAAMQIGDDLRARARLELVTELVPSEQAAWANLTLLALRRGEISEAALTADRALKGTRGTPEIVRIGALARLGAGDTLQALRLLASDVDARPDVRNLVALADILAAQGRSAEARESLETAARLMPGNAALTYRLALARARDASGELAREWAAGLLEASPPHPNPTALRSALEAIVQAPDDSLLAALERARNLLVRADWFRRDLNALQAPPELVADPVQRPVALKPVLDTAAPADRETRLLQEPIPTERRDWTWAGALHLDEDPLPSILLARGSTLHFPDESTIELPQPIVSRRSVAIQDLDQDFRPDLAIAGPNGVHILFQTPEGFRTRPGSVPALPPATMIEAVDFDMEGDLDLIVGLPEGDALVLRNKGDGTFQLDRRLPVRGLTAMTWGDLDGDGDPDLTTLTQEGALTFWSNLRNGQWSEPVLIAEGVRGVAMDDVDRDGTFDLALVRAGSAWSYALRDGQFSARELRIGPDSGSGSDSGAGIPTDVDGLTLTELDNNGALDWVVSTPDSTVAYLVDTDGALVPLPALTGFRLDGIAPLTDSGPPELFGRLASGQPTVHFAEGTAGYHWKRIRPRSAEVQGDRRINTFAVGGEVELRSGLLFQKRPISGGILHFGLGDNLLTEVARIVWPNGDVQIEFDLLSDETVLAQQRLKGSCPWVFANDGSGLQFVTDFLWRSPLGLKINAQETAGIATTSDWIRIPGASLPAIDGQYELRITAELWETHFFDHVALIAVDHADHLDARVDERFAFPPPDDRVQLFEQSRPFARVIDASGSRVDAAALERDGIYVAGFPRGPYQGIAEEHTTELLLPEEAPDRVHLLGFGWVRPTDSSINVAIGQGETPAPVSLQLEIPAQDGSWEVARADLGFPSGKEKTVLIDLSGLWAPGAERRFRLRTNLEIYWDRLRWAAPAGSEPVTQRLAPSTAELRYRGFSRVTAADSLSPEIPEYDALLATHPVWRDLVGYYTRFGDVRALLSDVDDRYVIMNAGDEMLLRFDALPPPPTGFSRDFVLVGDGWVKDGDLNTAFSTTILPLPTHASTTYSTAPSSLENDPVFQAHAGDWDRYHTRYIAAEGYHRALRVPVLAVPVPAPGPPTQAPPVPELPVP